MRFLLFAGLLALLAASQATDLHEDPPAPVAKTQAGNFVGFWTKSRSGRPIASFEGIPYAKPPVGDLRFHLPVPPNKVDTFQATKAGPPCVQRNTIPWNQDVWGEEDCLYINVYAPEKVDRPTNERLPVIFWIHGGGFGTGRGSDFKGTCLLDKDVLFVTINYRLGSLGFLTTEDGVIPHNLGLRDQSAGLEWVRDNIAGFGGNPDLVTIMGHSAGGSSVEHLLLSPLSKNLFHRAVSMSGSSFAPWAFYLEGETAETRRRVAEHLKCPPKPSADLLACLRTKSAREIIASEFIFKKFDGVSLRPFLPVVGGNTSNNLLPLHPRKMYEEGMFSDVPYISGLTNGEGAYITNGIFNNDDLIRIFNERFLEEFPEFLFRFNLTKEELESVRNFYFGSLQPFKKSDIINATDIITDDYFLWPTIQSERYRKIHAKSPRYLYYFGYGGGDRGISHGGDLGYIFGGNFDSNGALLSKAMVDFFTTFAKDGVPTTSALNVKWDPVTSKGSDFEYLHINTISDFKIKKDLLSQRWNFWDKLMANKAH